MRETLDDELIVISLLTAIREYTADRDNDEPLMQVLAGIYELERGEIIDVLSAAVMYLHESLKLVARLADTTVEQIIRDVAAKAVTS